MEGKGIVMMVIVLGERAGCESADVEVEVDAMDVGWLVLVME